MKRTKYEVHLSIWFYSKEEYQSNILSTCYFGKVINETYMNYFYLTGSEHERQYACIWNLWYHLTVFKMKIWIYWSESNSWIYFYIVLNKNWTRATQSVGSVTLKTSLIDGKIKNSSTVLLINFWWQFSRLAPVLHPKTSKTLFRPVNFYPLANEVAKGYSNTTVLP
jgi:hypothetical protein